jgi:hypothetical protein
MFRKWDKVTIWDWYRDTEDTIIEVDWKLFLDIHEEEVNEKNIEDFNIRFSSYNNRIIKFRVYDFNEEYMNYSPWIIFFSEQPEDPIEVIGYSPLYDTMDISPLMQYTWLKDKNWKDWYFWDIVKFYFDVYKDSLKIWMEEKIWVISENKYFQSCVISDWKEYHIDRLVSWEIIWNQFENPDLLSNK